MALGNDHVFAVCAYGESPYLDECIGSLLAQTVPSQVILCTSTPNASIRNSSERFGISLFESGKPAGIASDWNHALAAAEAPLVTIAHQDDVYDPRYAQRMLRAMAFMEHPLIYFTDYGELRDGRRVTDSPLLRTKRKMLAPLANGKNADSVRVRRKALSLGNPICCPSVTFAMEAIPKPIFESGFKSDLDWAAWDRISKMNGGFYYDPEILLYHRIHADSETSALIADATRTEEDLQMLKRFWPAPLAHLLNLVYRCGQRSNKA